MLKHFCYNSYNKCSQFSECICYERKKRGVFWRQENEYRIQLSFPVEEEKYIFDMFSDWSNVAQGVDTTKDEEILIFKKVFSSNDEFVAFIGSLDNNIIVKEIK